MPLRGVPFRVICVAGYDDGAVGAPETQGDDLASRQSLAGDGDPAQLATASEVLAAVRKAKSEAQASMRADVATATVTAPLAVLDRLRSAQGDIVSAGRVQSDLRLVEGVGPILVTATLA